MRAMTPEQVAERWGVSSRTIRDMCKSGTLPHMRLKTLYRIPVQTEGLGMIEITDEMVGAAFDAMFYDEGGYAIRDEEVRRLLAAVAPLIEAQAREAALREAEARPVWLVDIGDDHGGFYTWTDDLAAATDATSEGHHVIELERYEKYRPADTTPQGAK